MYMLSALRTHTEEPVMAERTLLTAFSNEWTLELAGGIVGLAWDDEGLKAAGDDACLWTLSFFSLLF